MMKAFDELTEKELAALTDEQTAHYVDVHLMEQGVLRGAAPEVVDRPAFGEIPTATYYGVGENGRWNHPLIYFEKQTDAIAVASMPMFAADYDYSAPNSELKYGKRYVDVIVKPVDLCDEAIYRQRVAETKAQHERFKQYEADLAQYNKDNEIVQRTAEYVYERCSEARAKKYRMNRICATHADYLRLSNGDADVALNFLKKAYSDSEITEAQEWYPNFVVQD